MSDSTCPVCRTAEIVSGKWTLLVIRDLADGSMRFCELERSLNGISPRTLSLRLRALEEAPADPSAVGECFLLKLLSVSVTFICSPPPVVGDAGTRETMTKPSLQEATPFKPSVKAVPEVGKPLYSLTPKPWRRLSMALFWMTSEEPYE